MSVNSTHPDYDTSATVWSRARDVFGGEDAVKAAGERYLPRLDSQSDDEYAAYKARPSFFNATGRTADGFVGLIFRREPKLTLPDARQATSDESGRAHLTPTLSPARRGSMSGVGRALAAFVEDADMLGTTLAQYAKNVGTEVIGVGRAGTLVDWEDGAEKRAYAVLYSAEQIINWRSERVNGRHALTLVVLKEAAEAGKQSAEGDEFQRDAVEQIRVLKLVEGPKSKVGGRNSSSSQERAYHYEVEIWQRNEAKSKKSKPEWLKVETRIPLRLGKALPLIPFVFHGPRNSLPDVDKLPLADIIVVNLDRRPIISRVAQGMLAKYGALVSGRSGAVRLVRA